MPAVTGQPWHFLQSRFWAEHKSSFGWHAAYVEIAETPETGGAPGSGGGNGAAILTLTRRLPAGLLLTYVPYAPARGGHRDGVPGPSPDLLAPYVHKIVPGIRDAVEAVCGEPVIIRFDLPQEAGAADDARGAGGSRAATLPGAHAHGLRAAPVDVQPPTTVILDLNPGPDELLGAMHKKNRYNIRLANRKGVRVRDAGAQELPRWYELYRETAARDRITIHSQAYYARLFELAAAYPEADLRLYLAEDEHELLAGVIVVHYGGGATYLYGASSNRKRNLMPNYALQWHAIVQAKEAGCSWYDLFGIPPGNDPAHPMHGLYRFKTGFGGRTVRRLGTWDVAVRPIRAGAFRLAERARDVYFHRMRRTHAR